MTEIQHNKDLIKKFPWLMPHNRWTDKIPEDYDYSYTELDNMPTGWRIAFGEKMCKEIQEVLETIEEKDNFRITQIKEKYGGLRFYTNWTTKELNEVFYKYEELSYHTCINCGAPATRISTGWICPWCDKCAELNNDRTIPIEDYFKDID